LYHWIARTRAERIITVSHFAKRDLIERLGISPAKMRVTYEAAEAPFSAEVALDVRHDVRRAYGLKGPFVFYVGGWEERKNVGFLIKAFAEAALEGVELVLGGAGPSGAEAQLRACVSQHAVEGRVRFVSPIRDEDLPALYAEALCFVYPSNYEGFGLQLCEAMASGCPTLAMRATSLPEILGEGGETFGPESSEELRTLLRRVFKDPQFRAELVTRARARSKAFAWRRTALETLSVYQELAESAGRGDGGRLARAWRGRRAGELRRSEKQL
jgi:glycosyltransferase involved in cell wall biosynthesis